MTLKELSELSGFSIGTVSKAFSGSHEISVKTRQKIFDIAEQSSNFGSLKLRKFSKKIISIIIPDIKTFSSVSDKLCDCVFSLDAVPIVLTSGSSKKKEAQLVEMCIKYKKSDGVVVINPQNDISDNRITSINITDSTTTSLSEAIKLLNNSGHTRISFISAASGKYSSVKFRNILAENGIRSGSNYYAECDGSSEVSGYETMEHLFGMPSVPTAVIAETNALANGVEKYILKRGLKVPKDISVIGLESLSKDKDINHLCKTAINDVIQKINSEEKRRKKDI